MSSDRSSARWKRKVRDMMPPRLRRDLISSINARIICGCRPRTQARYTRCEATSISFARAWLSIAPGRRIDFEILRSLLLHRTPQRLDKIGDRPVVRRDLCEPFGVFE